MDSTTQELELTDDLEANADSEQSIEVKRDVLRQSLEAIAVDVGKLLRDAGLDFQIGLTVPTSGHALLGMVCMTDPPTSEWTLATKVVCDVAAKALGVAGLRTRHLPCAVTNAMMSAAVVTTDLDQDL